MSLGLAPTVLALLSLTQRSSTAQKQLQHHPSIFSQLCPLGFALSAPWKWDFCQALLQATASLSQTAPGEPQWQLITPLSADLQTPRGMWWEVCAANSAVTPSEGGTPSGARQLCGAGAALTQRCHSCPCADTVTLIRDSICFEPLVLSLAKALGRKRRVDRAAPEELLRMRCYLRGLIDISAMLCGSGS